MIKKFKIILVILLVNCCLVLNTFGDNYQKWEELTNLAYKNFNEGQYEVALQLTKESMLLAGYEEKPLSLANLAAIYRKTGDTKKAEKISQKITSERMQLERKLKEEEKIYQRMKNNVRITSEDLPLGPVSEKFFDLMTIGKSIAAYKIFEDNANQGKVENSSFGAQEEDTGRIKL